MTKTICNMCGKEFDYSDDFGIRHTYGYGSVHDMDKLEVDLCNECLDKLTTYLIEGTASAFS